MKKQLLIFSIAMMAMWQNALAFDFSYTYQGRTLCYNIVDGNNAQVTYQYSSSPRYYNLTGSLSIPDSVTYNGNTYAVTSIGNDAFYGCYGLTSVTIGNGVTSIGEYAFRDCYGLTSVTIPDSVTSIGNYAFQNCSGLTSVTIGNAVTSIGNDAFQSCRGLTSVNYTGTVAQWCNIDFSDETSNPLYFSHSLNINGSPITNLVIPNGVTEIKQYAFYSCSGLTSVTIPNSVTSIGEYAFRGCTGLTSVTIGNSVASIGEQAFYNCLQISNIHMRGETPPTIQLNTFENVPASAHIYVPCGALAAYQNASAIFNQYSLSEEFGYSFSAASADPSKGNVQIIHAPECNNLQAEMQANAYHGFQFVRWSDGSTEAHRYLVVTQDTAIEAYFESTQGISDVQDGKDIAIYVEDGRIVVREAKGIDVKVFDMKGRLVSGERRVEDGEIVVPVQASGVYVVKIGNLPARKIVVVR